MDERREREREREREKEREREGKHYNYNKRCKPLQQLHVVIHVYVYKPCWVICFSLILSCCSLLSNAFSLCRSSFSLVYKMFSLSAIACSFSLSSKSNCSYCFLTLTAAIQSCWCSLAT